MANSLDPGQARSVGPDLDQSYLIPVCNTEKYVEIKRNVKKYLWMAKTGEKLAIHVIIK